MRRWIMGSLTIILILGMVGGILLAQEEEVYPPVEEAAYSPAEEAVYSPEEVIPVVEPVVSAPARPTNAVQNIEAVDLPEKVRIIIHTTQPAEYIIGKVYQPKMLYVDILNSVNDLPRKRLRVKKGAVARIRSSQYQVLPTEITRIVIDLDRWVKHEVAKEENKLYLEFYKPEVLVAKVEAPPEEKASPEEEEKVPPGKEEAPLSEERLISLSFTDAPMSAVLNFLAEMSGYNIVASAAVTKGTVTITLKDVPVMIALDTILEMQGLWYKKVRNIIRIMTIEEFQSTLAVKADLTRVFTLQYADAEELAKVLNNVLGGAVTKKSPKTVSVSTLWGKEELSKAIEATKNVVFKGKTFVIAEARTNSLIITTDDPRNFIMLEMLIKELDTEVPQVLLEAAVIEVTLDDTTAFGISWVWKTLHTGAGNIRPELKGFMRWDEYDTVLRDEGRDVAGPVDTPGLWLTPSGDYKIGLANRDVTFLLQALVATNKVDVLSTPRILTLNNEPALIQVGKEYPIKYGWDDYRYRQLGVILKILPKINKDRFVNVEVRQEILKWVGDSKLDLPIFDKRIVESNALVKSGHTMVIGGMIEKRTTDDVKKVPWLGDIPVLKYLFRRTSKKVENIELMILITPYVITSPGEGTRMTRKQVRDLSTAKVAEEDIHVPEAKIEIPELEEAEIPEIIEEEKK